MSKTVVITGGTGGIGLHTAIGIARTGARVLVTGRRPDAGAEAVARIQAESGNEDVAFVQGDVSTKAGVAALSDALLAKTDRIDVLVNNAGLMAQERQVNEDGFELDFAVNVVAPYLLTLQLQPALAAAAPSRVLMVTGGKASGPFDPTDLQSEQGFVPLVSYTRTKRACEAMSLALAAELEPARIYLSIVYPGRASTAMTRAMTPRSLPWFLRPAWPVFRILIPTEDGGKSAARASQSSVFAATSETVEGKAGVYIDTNQQVAKLHPTVHDPANQAKVLDAIRG
ncbi:MAG: SDR family NAD(P)-dependent oxidoreductase [Deltaproteobacteria bacterium]|nr:MAG: SDR family NAD(P)-dependent oxidoreductase [Deltaproteobacteria bacterium]